MRNHQLCGALWVAALAALAIFVSSCAGASSDGLGSVRFTGSDTPVSGAQVTPLIGDPISRATPDPNMGSATTNDAGEFELEEVTNQVFVQVTVDVPSAAGAAVGRLDYRATYDPTSADTIAIPEPTSCAALTDCGTPQLPDLRPIIRWDDLDPQVVERLLPTTQGPPTAGLLPAGTWFIETIDDRRLLRFATVAANVGDGPLDIIASPGDRDRSPTWQRIWTDEFAFEDVESGEFLFHEGHDHIHFDAFERYRLLNEAGDVVASSEKVSFCLRDSVQVVSEPSAFRTQFDDGNCDGQQQVINAGFGDHYHALLDDQWIDVTGVAPGAYTVEITVDPLDNIVEIDETNNTGSFSITIEDGHD